jgi:hypothetical protein
VLILSYISTPIESRGQRYAQYLGKCTTLTRTDVVSVRWSSPELAHLTSTFHNSSLDPPNGLLIFRISTCRRGRVWGSTPKSKFYSTKFSTGRSRASCTACCSSRREKQVRSTAAYGSPELTALKPVSETVATISRN